MGRVAVAAVSQACADTVAATNDSQGARSVRRFQLLRGTLPARTERSDIVSLVMLLLPGAAGDALATMALWTLLGCNLTHSLAAVSLVGDMMLSYELAPKVRIHCLQGAARAAASVTVARNPARRVAPLSALRVGEREQP